VLEVQVLGRLGERRVGGRRGEQLRLGNASGLAGVVSRHLHGQEDALGAAGAHRTGVGLGVEELTAHRDDVELHLQDARVLERVQGVVMQVAHPDLFDQFLVVVIADVVDQAESPTSPPVDVFSVTGFDLGQELLVISTVLWDPRGIAHGART
jgi:hypothetical protein